MNEESTPSTLPPESFPMLAAFVDQASGLVVFRGELWSSPPEGMSLTYRNKIYVVQGVLSAPDHGVLNVAVRLMVDVSLDTPTPLGRPVQAPPLPYASRSESWARPLASPGQARPQAPPLLPPPSAPQDAEYTIGAKVLPRVGAAILIVGFAYLVSIALARGFITPAMLWTFASVLSLAFIAAGQFKRREKEQFGEILTGIGFVSLYLNFAAGCQIQHLYSGETMLGLFLANSAAIQAYAYRRSSRTFLAIGLLGGLLSALMPLDQRLFVQNVELTFLVVSPALFIAVKRGWPEAVMAIWSVTMSALIPAATMDAQRPIFMASAFLGITAYSLLAFFRRSESSPFDPDGVFPTLAAVMGAFAAICTTATPAGTMLITGYACVLVGLTYVATKDSTLRARIALGSVITVGLLAPWGINARLTGQTFPSHAWIQLGLAIGFAILSRYWKHKATAMLSLANLILGVASYLSVWPAPSGNVLVQLLFLTLVGTILCTWSVSQTLFQEEQREARRNVRVVGAIVCWGIVVQLGTTLAEAGLGLKANFGASAASGIYAFILLIVGFWKELKELRFVSFGILALTVAKVVLVDLSDLDSMIRVGILMLLGVPMMLGGYWYIRNGDRFQVPGEGP